jgi:excisionase family DNA binding protein
MPPTPTVAVAPGYLGYRRAAAYCGLGERTLRRAVAAGRLPACRVGRRVLLAHADLDRFVRGEPTPTPTSTPGDPRP